MLKSVLKLLERCNHLCIIVEVLTREHDAEPAWLGSGELTSSLDHPSAVLVELLPQLVLCLPGAFLQEASEVNPSHQSTVGLEKWDVCSSKGILESVARGSQSLLGGLYEVVHPGLVFQDLLK